MINKVIFLDIDGPMIPTRAYFLPHQTKIVSVFDPVAVSLLLRVLNQSEAKLVISSTWGLKGREIVVDLLSQNGIMEEYLHPDWVTPRKFSSDRPTEILWWLDKHPEVTHHVILDDAQINLPNMVRVSLEDGLMFRHYQKMLLLLEAN